MAYINVDEVYILDNTGAQVDAVTDIPFKADAGLTDAQKAQARANLGISAGGGGVNRNLLDNAWFTVNQRGATGASSSSYGLDRWEGIQDGYAVNNDGSVTITGRMRQLGDWSYVWGKTVTISAMNTSGTVASWTGTMAAGTYSLGSMVNVTVTSATEINFYAVSNLKAVKLELGSTSTLAQDAPPDYGTELAKCMRYFQRIKGTSTNYAPIGLGFTTSASSGVIAAVLVPLPVPLRATAITVAKSGNLSLLAGSTSYTPSAITYYDHTEQQLRLNVTASGMTAGQFCYLQFSQSAAYIDLSADL